MQSIDELIEANKGLIFMALRRFYLLNDPEAESAAYWALYKAISTYDASKHTLLSTYATCCIYNALGDYLRALKRRPETVSYNATAFEDTEFLDMFADPITTEDKLLRVELVQRTKDAIVDISNGMKNVKKKSVVDLYVANDYEITTTELAKQLGVSQGYASQTISEFKFELKKKMEGYYRERSS